MKQIVICGGGFGGLNCALELSRLLPEAKITLVDSSPYHTLHAFFYELASSDEEVTSMTDLSRSVAVPIADLVKGTNIEFQQGVVKSVDGTKKTVVLDRGSLSYDYLVLALGSEANYYGIPGAAEHALSLKTMRDALAIRNKIEFAVQAAKMSGKRDKVRFIIAGGGFAGVELAAELVGLLDFLAWKNSYPRELMELVVVEGSPQLMSGLGERVSRDTTQRLDELGVRIQTKSLITNVTETFVEFNSGEKLHYDALVWTAGVKAVNVPITPDLGPDRGGRIPTTEYFQAQRQADIFVIGDQCCFIGTDGRPLPGTATQAIDQGKYVAHAIAEFSRNRTPAPYQCKDFGYAIPLGGKWGIGVTPHLYKTGRAVIWMRTWHWFHYLRPLIGFWPAVKLLFFQNKLYSRND